MTTKVYDIDGTEKDLEWLAAEWDGCEVLPARILAGNTEYWQLAAIYCTTGPAVFKAEVRRGAVPADNQPVILTWPNLTNPSNEIPTLPHNPHNWAPRGVTQRTENGGITGFGLGSTFGPFYHAWVSSSAPSDCLSKTGMMGGTNHSGPLHGVWVLSPITPTYVTLNDALHGEAQRNQKIQFNPQAALQSRIFADGFVPNSPEFDLTFDDVDYRAQRAEHLGSGVVRAYYAVVGQWGDVRFIEW